MKKMTIHQPPNHTTAKRCGTHSATRFNRTSNLQDAAEDLLRKAAVPKREVSSCVPPYSAQDRAAVLRVLDGESVWRLNSEASNRLVGTFREKVNGAKHLLPTDSGTAGLHVTLTRLIRSRGPRVLVPAWTWYAVPTTVLNSGGTPVFVDVDPATLQLVPFSDRINVDCAVASHLFGIPALNREHLNWLSAHNVPLVEDCAQTIQGLVDQEHPVGKLGVAAVYSFNGSKAIPAGEGGMIATNDDQMASHFLNFTMSVTSPAEAVIRRFNDASEGWNYRLASVSASLAESLLHTLPQRIQIAVHAHKALVDVITPRTWLMLVGASVSALAPLGSPVRLLRPVRGLTLAQSRELLYRVLRLAGFPVSIWVADAIPATRRMRRYYQAHPKEIPEPKNYAGASAIADSHLIFATNSVATADYKSGRLAAIFDVYEECLNT